MAHVALRLLQLLRLDELHTVDGLGVQQSIIATTLEVEEVIVVGEDGDVGPAVANEGSVLLTHEVDGVMAHLAIVPLLAGEDAFRATVGGGDEVVDDGVHVILPDNCFLCPT